MTDLVPIDYILFDSFFFVLYSWLVYYLFLTERNKHYIIKIITGIIFLLVIISIIIMTYLDRTNIGIPDNVYDIVLYGHLSFYVISICFLIYVYKFSEVK